MTSSKTDPAEFPETAAEATRGFNHATLFGRDGRPGMKYPGTAYRAIGAFKTLAQRLPQSFDQTGMALADMLKAGHLTAYHGTPTEHVAATWDALREAERHATALAAALNRAHSAASPIGYSGPLNTADDDFDDDL